MKELPSLEYLNTRLSLDGDTGVLTWKEREDKKASVSSWNAKFAGKFAGAKQPNSSGYLSICIDNESYQTSRIVYFMARGEDPYGFQVDHINQVKVDNRPCNLRKVNNSGNQRITSLRKDNTSGIEGVSFCNTRKVWKAKLGDKHLGSFKDKTDAVYLRYYSEQEEGWKDVGTL